ncbi:hypothetical protein G5714_015202 [Onychostoma macrolepis]|uniref:Uncharacterized protein n=1 Tax=Onychostoma macrolepis TaxID=369639 RepID=A0A7J6CC78_9TELE|nr:hypothetical protein G5714_015202 [Onychostoma macrolepis]
MSELTILGKPEAPTSPSSVAAHAGVLPSSTRLHTVGVQGFLSGRSSSRTARNRDRETGISRQPQPTTGSLDSHTAPVQSWSAKALCFTQEERDPVNIDLGQMGSALQYIE